MKSKIAEVRKKKGLTQGELAIKANTSSSYLCRVEKGNRIASLHFYEKIAKVLNKRVKDLIE